ncbi:hypothetical protein BDB01DRAFT_34211 [Pilobolus umbonatus]|nr:hypothetical protein BDB01DRAFT_34211 [Pilobolus umbonatus]
MTTNMNFGPEWMRGGFSKQTNSNLVSSDRSGPILSFNDKQENGNTFRYSKEFMLSLYNPTLPLPSDFHNHEYVTVEERNVPLAFQPLTEAEKKLLAGPIHSEAPRRNMLAGDKARYVRNDSYGSPMQSPASENGPTTPGGRFGRKGRIGDYFTKDASKRVDNDTTKRRGQSDEINSSLGKLDDDGDMGWSKAASLTSEFNHNGLFQGENDTFKPVSKFAELSSSTFANGSTASSAKKPEEFKWYYRDPSGQVQGPFEAQEMQDWYKAGFFTPTLMLRREDEAAFEPLMVLIRKVANEDQPFLSPFSSRPAGLPDFPRAPANGDLFGSSDNTNNLFRTNTDNKYMPFSSVSTPGGSVADNFLTSTSSLYQNPYNYNSHLLRDNRWNEAQPSPSWLNHNPSDLFGSHTNPLASNPLIQPGLNSMFSSNLNSPSLFDYQRAVNDQFEQHQQYLQLLQQKQQQQNIHFQQQLQQQQMQQQLHLQQQFQQQQQTPQQQPQHTPYQSGQTIQDQVQPFQSTTKQETHSFETEEVKKEDSEPIKQMEQLDTPDLSNPLQQNKLKALTLENFSNHASPILRPNILTTGGWGSVPGTPLGNDTPSSPWGTIVPAAIPNKMSEELQFKAPGTQSPRTPSSPKKMPASIEKPSAPKVKNIIQSFAEIQLEEERNSEINRKRMAAETIRPVSPTDNLVNEEAAVVTETPKTAPSVPIVPSSKPIVSLREIQEEELRIAEEKKQKQAKMAALTPTWSNSSSTLSSSAIIPSISTPTTWTQPSLKPLSLREIQEMEAKEAESNKKETVSDYISSPLPQKSNSNVLSWATSTKSNIVPSSPIKSGLAWTATNAPKKTLREIQQEEEVAMKKKNAKNAKTQMASVVSSLSKPSSSSTVSSSNEGWTTVTNVRVPKPTVTPAPVPVTFEPKKWEPVQKQPVVRAVRVDKAPSEEFRRWCKYSLRDLNRGVNGKVE